MYIPPAFAVESPAEVLAVLRSVAFGHLVTQSVDGAAGSGMTSTPLPFIIDDSLSTVRAHFARANRVWKDIDGTSALLIVPSVDAYISPRWYASKAEHGKVVPTWNYEVVHITGNIEIHDEVEWKRQMVGDLTDHHEAAVSEADGTEAWQVSDAPDDFVAGQLKAIVGVQLNITAVEGKQKLSQNKPEADRAGAAQGLAASERPSDVDISALMRGARP